MDTQFKLVQDTVQKVGLDPNLLRLSIERLASRGTFDPLASALSATETEFLDAHSGTIPADDDLLDSQLETAIAEVRQVDEALDVAAVSTLMKVGKARVRQLIGEGRLYALPSSAGRGNSRLFPAWQFVSGRPIPHVGEVAAALPAPAHPAQVEAFFRNAIVEDPGSDLSMVVRDWLLSGGSAEPVIEMASEMAHGL